MGAAPQTIQTLLHASPELGQLIRRARALSRIQAILLEYLPEAARPCVHVASHDGHCLTLHVSNAAWATRLRYQEQNICTVMARHLRMPVTQVRIRVRPALARPEPPRPRPATLSASTRRHLARTATYINDRDLSEALQRLSAAGDHPD